MKLITIALLSTLSFMMVGSENLHHNWVLAQLEEFGSKWAPGEENAKDHLNLKNDGTYTMVLYGSEKSGTYTHNVGAKTINFVNGDEKLFFKLVSVSDTALTVEYQQPSLIRTKMHYKIGD